MVSLRDTQFGPYGPCLWSYTDPLQLRVSASTSPPSDFLMSLLHHAQQRPEGDILIAITFVEGRL